MRRGCRTSPFVCMTTIAQFYSVLAAYMWKKALEFIFCSWYFIAYSRFAISNKIHSRVHEFTHTLAFLLYTYLMKSLLCSSHLHIPSHIYIHYIVISVEAKWFWIYEEHAFFYCFRFFFNLMRSQVMMWRNHGFFKTRVKVIELYNVVVCICF